MLLHMNGKFTMGKFKSSLLSLSFVLNRPSLSISRCRPMYEADVSVSVVSFISRYSRACGSCHDVLDSGLLLTRMLLNQRFLLVKLKSSHRKSYGRHHDLVDVMEYLCHN
jgi:hypothetical protein